MFQDSAGTTPVTAVEQPVGLMLDKSGRGNHATQATSTKRPVLSAKVNLLTGSAALATQSVATAAIPYTLKQTGTGTITLSGTSTAGPLVGPGTLTFTPTAGTLTLTVTGSVTEAQLEAGSVATRYQWANTVADYDTVGFNKYLKFDGVDDSLLASLAFSQHPHMIVAGVKGYTGESDIVGTGGTTEGHALLMIYNALTRTRAHVWTSILSSVDSTNTIISGSKCIASQIFTSDTLSARLNGVSTTIASTGVPSTTESGTLVIGSRTGSTNFFNGNIYSLIIRGVQSTDAQIINAETYVNSKTGAY
jgi:hypothetical protein